MALSIAFKTIKLLNKGMLKGAKKLAKQQGRRKQGSRFNF